MNQERDEAEVQGELFKRRRNEIPDAERVQMLQEKLYQKAKQERFPASSLVNADEEVCRKAVCGKTARTV